MKNEHPTSVEELNALTKPELVDLAEQLGLTVERGDGQGGDPLIADYVKTISESFTASPGQLQEQVNTQGRFTTLDGRHATESGELADAKGNVIEE